MWSGYATSENFDQLNVEWNGKSRQVHMWNTNTKSTWNDNEDPQGEHAFHKRRASLLKALVIGHTIKHT